LLKAIYLLFILLFLKNLGEYLRDKKRKEIETPRIPHNQKENNQDDN
jgi:hypothetical protein